MHACVAGAFKQQILYIGGAEATERLHLLHGNAAIADTFEVVDVRPPLHRHERF